MSDIYFMSPPSRGWALRGRANFRSREAGDVDPRRARQEWLRLAEAIERRGATVVALPPPSDALTGMPYAAECGHVVGTKFLMPRMASEHRKAEREHWARLARAMGFELVDPGEGVWEAQGDVASFEGVTLLFFGGRTDRAGMEAAARSFDTELLRLEIREPAFHGNMAACPLPAVRRMLVCPEVLVGDAMDRLRGRFGRQALMEVTETEIRRYATNGLPIGDGLFAPSTLPERVAGLVRRAGMRVELFPMRELCDKAGGASRCLVSYARIDRARIRVPPENTLTNIVRTELRHDGDDQPSG